MSFEDFVCCVRCNEEFKFKFSIKDDIICLGVCQIPLGNITKSIN